MPSLKRRQKKYVKCISRQKGYGGGGAFFGPPSAPFLSALQLQCCVVRETSKSNIPQGRLVMDTGGEGKRERERDLFLVLSGCCSEKGVGRSGCIDTPTTRKRPTFPIPKLQRKGNKMPLSCSKGKKGCFFCRFIFCGSVTPYPGPCPIDCSWKRRRLTPCCRRRRRNDDPPMIGHSKERDKKLTWPLSNKVPLPAKQQDLCRRSVSSLVLFARVPTAAMMMLVLLVED